MPNTRSRNTAMSNMEEIVKEYKQDAYGNPIKTHLFYPVEKPAIAMPIGW